MAKPTQGLPKGKRATTGRTRRFRPRLDRLELRDVPSSSIPLNGERFVPIGPSPLVNGQSPGQLINAGGSTEQIAITIDVTAPAGFRMFVASDFGGIWRSSDAGVTWQMVTIAEAKTGRLLPAEYTAITAVDRVDPITGINTGDFDTIYAASTIGTLRSLDGGDSWQWLNAVIPDLPLNPDDKSQPPPYDPATLDGNIIDLNGKVIINPLTGKPVPFAPARISKLVVKPSSTLPNDPGKDVILSAVTLGAGDGFVTSGIWRSLDGGGSWRNMVDPTTTPFFAPPDTLEFTDVIIDPTDLDNNAETIDRVYIAVGNQKNSAANGVYLTKTASDVLPQWNLALGGAAVFPGQFPGNIRIALSPTRPSVAFASVTAANTGQVLDVFRTIDSGTTWARLNVPINYQNKYANNGLIGFGSLSNSIAVSPLSNNEPFGQIVVAAGWGDAVAGTPNNIIVSLNSGANWRDISGGGFADLAGPYVDVDFITFDPLNRLVVATGAGVYRNEQVNLALPPQWVSINGVANYPTNNQALQLTAVAQFGAALHPSSSNFSVINHGFLPQPEPQPGTTGAPDYREYAFFHAARFEDRGGNDYSWATTDGNPNPPPHINDLLLGTGMVLWDFADPDYVYRVTPFTKGADWIRRSTDGGQTWQGVAINVPGNAPANSNRPIALNPSNNNQLFVGTNTVSVSNNRGNSWGALFFNAEGGQGVPIPPIPSSSAGTVTAIAVSREKARIFHVNPNFPPIPLDFTRIFASSSAIAHDGLWGPNVAPFAVGRMYYVDIGISDVGVPLVNWQPMDFPGNVLTGESITQIISDPTDAWQGYVVTTDGRVLHFSIDPNFYNRFLDPGAFGYPIRAPFSVIWRDISAPGFATVIGLDPSTLTAGFDDVLYAGTASAGGGGAVFKLDDPGSFDRPKVWRPVGLYTDEDGITRSSLPNIRVTDIDINTTTGILQVGTRGRGVWQLQIRNLVRGQKFHDLNGNGIKDADEPGLQGWVIRVIDLNDPNNPNDDIEVAVTQTDANGFYEFRNLPAGTYRVVEDVRPGWFQTTPNPRTFTATATASFVAEWTRPDLDIPPSYTIIPELDFGNMLLGSITGVVFNDANADGVRNPGEVGLEGFTVFLDNNDNGALDPGEPFSVTDLFGNYVFLDLGPGPHRIRYESKFGFLQTTFTAADILLGSGEGVTSLNNPSVDIGLLRPASLSGLVYDDRSGDGFRQPGEPGIGGFTVYLDLNGNGKLDPGEPSIASGPDGRYEFINLAPGRYDIRQVGKAGWQLTSDPAIAVDLGTFDTPGNFEFGNFKLIEIGGLVFNDLTANGVRDPSDPGLPNWTIQLRGAGPDNVFGTPDDTFQFVTTTKNGTYTIPGIGPGLYRVRQIPLTGWIQITADPADITVPNLLGYGNRNFGVYEKSFIAGTVFNDADQDGSRDPGEVGLAGFKVFLDANNNGALDPGELFVVTDAQGAYNMGPLDPGPHRVRIVGQTGFQLTTPQPPNLFPLSGETVGGVNFGLFRQGSIAGVVFRDVNGNGARDPGDNGLGGFTVFLDANNNGKLDPGERSFVTAGDGTFQFVNLAAGTYNVVQVVPSNWQQTTASIHGQPLTPINLGPTQSVSGVSFGNFRRVTIRGNVFTDLNQNGVRDLGDGGLIGQTVRLINTATGEAVASTTTDGAGQYLFPDVGTGVYRIDAPAKAGFVRTTPQPGDFSIGPPTTPLDGYDFGFFQLGSLTGLVFDDRNANGLLDPGEGGLAGFTVFLDVNGNGAFDPGEPSTITNSEGSFLFANLGAGPHRVRQVVPPGFQQTTLNPGDIALTSGTTATVRFGNRRLASAFGFAFEDRNGNGARDANEPGLAGVVVRLLDPATGAVARQTTTGADGRYEFISLEPGTYRIRQLVPPNSVQTTLFPSDPVVGDAGAVASGDFGSFKTASVAGTVFEDLNGDGVRGINEPPVDGFTVYLDYNFNNRLDPGEPTRVTINGAYSFTNLPPGNYAVRQVLPAGWVATTPPPAIVTPISGASITGIDFGNFRRTGISGTVFLDRNGNGVREPNEEGLPGFVVELTGPSGVVTRLTTGASGSYTFPDLPAGQYRVQQLSRRGFSTPRPPGGHLVNLESNAAVTGRDFANANRAVFVVGRDAGSTPEVSVYATDSGQLLRTFPAYDAAFAGGVRVAQGFFGGEVANIVTAPGPGGGPDVRVFDGATGALVRSFFAYDAAFTGGVYVAVGDVNGDGVADIVTGADIGGGPDVRVFDGATGNRITSFFAFAPMFTGGVRVAVGDVNGDGFGDVIVGAGPGGGPNVRVFDVRNGNAILSDFFAYPAGFLGGVTVSGGDVDGDGRADVITGAGPGGGPHVRAFDGLSPSRVIAETFAFEIDFRGGVRVANADLNFDGRADLLGGPGSGRPARVRGFGFNAAGTFQELLGVAVFDPAFLGGVFVG